MSPRRSSRARTTQPPSHVTVAHSNSSSGSSSRADRATRGLHKQSSPRKSSTPHSLSSDDVDDANPDAAPEPPLTRRRTRELDNDEDEPAKLDDAPEEEMNEEEEITRCVCGQQEYAGPPSDTGKSRDSHAATLADPDMHTDDAGGLFIQCDVCKVWQHGGCVGIMDEAASPDEYYCEECRPHLHKLMTSSKGQKFSRYLPVYELSHGKSARKSSASKEPEHKSSRDKDRNARVSADSFSKRRSTMNSRAAYDEDEVLRKVLEESKNEGGGAQSENGNRKKRSRDESEEVDVETKRQRTSSKSRSNSPAVESEDETPKNTAAKQKPRGAAARSQREKEIRDKERERERAEAANRRKGRAERRKAEEMEADAMPAEEPPKAPSVTESVPPETPTVEQKPPPVSRKSGRPPQRRGKLGRNQYSRDNQPPHTNGASPAPNDGPNSPQVSTTNGTGTQHDSSDGTVGQKPAKSKNWRLEKLSWNEIRRPAGAMQNYIAQRQVEMAGEKRSPAPAVQSPAATNGEVLHASKTEPKKEVKTEAEDLDDFKSLNTLQMMDSLSRDLVHWQRKLQAQNEK